jgi:HK97 family phage major capsid protein
MSAAIEALKNKLIELHETAKALQAKADAESRDMTPEELKEMELITAEFDSTEDDIKRREKIAAQETKLSASVGRVSKPITPGEQPMARAPAQTDDGLKNTRLSTVEERQRWGFRHFGEFAAAVKNAAVHPAQGLDARLIANAALSTYGSEGVGGDGGFAVPPEWRADIMRMVEGEESLLAMCDQQTASGNSITFPIDEATAWQSSGGIQAYWDSEASAMTQSKPQLKDLTCKLSRLTALVPVTDELLEDGAAMGSYVASKAGEKLSFKVTDAIINGTGVGQPLGILNAACTVSVAKETSQTATTFHADNAVKMMARMPAQSFARSVWLINQDVVPQILRLGFAITTAAGTAAGAGALYLAPNGLATNSPYGTLLGRPIFVTEACATLGTVGDVILADMTKYLAVVKSGGLRSDTSIHLWFDQNTTAFRFVLRMNGQPWLSAAIARKSGSNTLSHFVTVATRS